MLGENTDSYYADRAAKERAIADKATDPAIRKIHLDMAERYELLAMGESAPAMRQSTG